jgi:hypothetical protein
MSWRSRGGNRVIVLIAREKKYRFLRLYIFLKPLLHINFTAIQEAIINKN